MKKETNEKKEFIKGILNKLIRAYAQQVFLKKEMDFMVDLIYERLKKRNELNEKYIKNAYHELLDNYVYYKKINAASFFTAYMRANHGY